jgi:hypothetical protein
VIANGRKYRDSDSRAMPVWNGILEHRARIDDAIWVFLWCIDAVTKERNGEGIVYSGAPVKIAKIAKALDFNRRTVERHLKQLEAGRYITRTRTPYGYVIRVSKSLKFGIWKRARYDKDVASLPREMRQACPRDTTNLSRRCDKAVVNKEDSAIDSAKDSASDTRNLPLKAKGKVKRDRFGTILANQGD